MVLCEDALPLEQFGSQSVCLHGKSPGLEYNCRNEQYLLLIRGFSIVHRGSQIVCRPRFRWLFWVSYGAMSLGGWWHWRRSLAEEGCNLKIDFIYLFERKQSQRIKMTCVWLTRRVDWLLDQTVSKQICQTGINQVCEQAVVWMVHGNLSVCRNWFRQLLVGEQREKPATVFTHFHANLTDSFLSTSSFSILPLWQFRVNWTEDEVAPWRWPALRHSSEGWCACCPLVQRATHKYWTTCGSLTTGQTNEDRCRF